MFCKLCKEDKCDFSTKNNVPICNLLRRYLKETKNTVRPVQWPKDTEEELIKFYGKPTIPSGAWYHANIIYIKPPWKLWASWDLEQRIRRIAVHSKCAPSLRRILDRIWDTANRRQSKIEEAGLHLYGGGFCYRLKKGGGVALSMHAYGAAIDFDPLQNQFGDDNPRLAQFPWIVEAFKDEGWTWGGMWKVKDGMHFQAVR